MSVRVRYALSGAVSSTTAEERDLGNVRWEIVADTAAKGGSIKTVLAAGAVDVLLQIDNLSTISLLIVRTQANDANDTPSVVTIKRNSAGGEAIPVLPVGTAAEGHFVLSTDTSLTSVYASNNAVGAVPMALTILAVGS